MVTSFVDYWLLTFSVCVCVSSAQFCPALTVKKLQRTALDSETKARVLADDMKQQVKYYPEKDEKEKQAVKGK